jgi:hypothetical protein
MRVERVQFNRRHDVPLPDQVRALDSARCKRAWVVEELDVADEVALTARGWSWIETLHDRCEVLEEGLGGRLGFEVTMRRLEQDA